MLTKIKLDKKGLLGLFNKKAKVGPKPKKKSRTSKKVKKTNSKIVEKKPTSIKKLKTSKSKVKKKTSKVSKKSSKKIDLSNIKKEIFEEIKQEVSSSKKKSLINLDLSEIRKEISQELKRKHSKVIATDKKNFMYTGIEGFDELLEKGIPKGSAVLLAGGAGCGKTIFGLQTLNNHIKQGEKCIYMSFEESENRLIGHMEEFGWNPKKYIKKGNLLIKRINPFEITRNVDALLMKAKGELLIDVKPIIFPKNFKPDIIVVDSLTAIASAFTGKEDSYRIYIEQLFRFFEEIGATSFLITETEQVPKIFSPTGVEEFLADSVVVIYNIKRGNIRERAIEVLKLRGAGHKNKIVALNISGEGINVYPQQEVFGNIE